MELWPGWKREMGENGGHVTAAQPVSERGLEWAAPTVLLIVLIPTLIF